MEGAPKQKNNENNERGTDPDRRSFLKFIPPALISFGSLAASKSAGATDPKGKEDIPSTEKAADILHQAAIEYEEISHAWKGIIHDERKRREQNLIVVGPWNTMEETRIQNELQSISVTLNLILEDMESLKKEMLTKETTILSNHIMRLEKSLAYLRERCAIVVNVPKFKEYTEALQRAALGIQEI